MASNIEKIFTLLLKFGDSEPENFLRHFFLKKCQRRFLPDKKE